MSLSELWQTDVRRLRDDDTIETALAAFRESAFQCLPVVDASGRLLGVFSEDRLLSMLLPKAVTVGGLSDLSFLMDDPGQVRQKFMSIRGEPVGRHVLELEKPIHPETSLMEVLLLMFRGENEQPVSDPESGKLLGMVSASHILQEITGKE